MSSTPIHADPPPEVVCEPYGFTYLTGSMLGKGGFAICYKAEVCQDDQKTGNIVALKIVRSQMPYDKLAQKFVTELQLHSKMQHPNIVEFYRAFAFGTSTYVALEICDRGSLADVLRRRKFVTMPEIRRFLIQTCGAVKYLHTRHIVHRDLKTGNLFLDKHMNIKVGDFGLAALVVSKNDIGHRRTTMCGTPNYLAPEILEKSGRGHNEKVDLWAIGIIAYTLAVGKAPFHAQVREEIYKRLQSRDYRWPSPDETANEISDDLQDLVGSLLVHEDDRPCPDKIVSHKFFKLEYVPDRLDPNCTHKPPVFRIPVKSAEALARGFSSTWFMMCKASGVGEVSPGRCFPVHGGRRMPSIIRECEAEIEVGRYPVVPFPEDVVYEPFPLRPNLFRPAGPEGLADTAALQETNGNDAAPTRRALADPPRRTRHTKENNDPVRANVPALVRKNSRRGAAATAASAVTSAAASRKTTPLTGTIEQTAAAPATASAIVAATNINSTTATTSGPTTTHREMATLAPKLDDPDRVARAPARLKVPKQTTAGGSSRDQVSEDLSSRMKALSTNVSRKLSPAAPVDEESGSNESKMSKTHARNETRRLEGVRARIRAVISSRSRSRSRSRSGSRQPEPSPNGAAAGGVAAQASAEDSDGGPADTHTPSTTNGHGHAHATKHNHLVAPVAKSMPRNRPTGPQTGSGSDANSAQGSQAGLSTKPRSTPGGGTEAPTAALVPTTTSTPAHGSHQKDGAGDHAQTVPEMVKIPFSDTESVVGRLMSLRDALNSALQEAASSPQRVMRSPRLPYVSKWIDYSKRDGVGYVLEDGTVGCIQNASAPQPVQFTVVRNGYNRLLNIRRDPKTIETMPLEYFADFGKHGVRSVYIAPHRRKASCACWRRFGAFMFQKLLAQQANSEPVKPKPKPKKKDGAVEAESEEDEVDVDAQLAGGPFVRFYQRLGNVGIWGFQDGTFQFNFPDHTKLVVSPDGQHSNFLCLSSRGTREMVEKGSVTADLIQEREMLPMTVLSLLSPMAMHHPQASLAPANLFREKIGFIVAVLGEWISNSALGRLSGDSKYMQWTGRQVRDGANRLDWSTVGAAGGDGEKYSVTLPAQ